MKVFELIKELEKCNPNDIVMYDAENSIYNGDFSEGETCTGVEDVLIGYGTVKGFVFLTDERIEDEH